MRHESILIKWDLLIVLAILFLNGCRFLYTDVYIPRSYRSASPIDVEASLSDKVVTGEGCNHSVLFLVAWGNEGYAAAVKNALNGEPPGSILYDVQTDLKARAYVLGFYTQSCTVVTGKVALHEKSSRAGL